MSLLAKLSWLLCSLSVMVLVIARLILGGWVDYLFIPLAIFCISLLMAIVLDFKLYLEFFTMRTTKYGLNMGTMIILAIAFLISINFLAIRYDKAWDLTEGKVLSLSDESRNIIKGLDNNVELKIFYKPGESQQSLPAIKSQLEIYQNEFDVIEPSYIDVYSENAISMEYLNGQVAKNGLVGFVEYEGRRIRIDFPFNEENITNAIIKATRSANKVIYFTQGHGERLLESIEAEGINTLKTDLENSSFTVKTLNLLQENTIPEDAHILAIVGPRLAFLEQELSQIRDFLRKGGRLFLAIDPGEKHQLARLTKSMGVEFSNNFVFDQNPVLRGQPVAAAIGVVYDQEHPVTQKLSLQPSNINAVYSLLFRASELVEDPQHIDTIKVVPLVRTQQSYTLTDARRITDQDEAKQVTVAMAASGKMAPAQGSADSAAKKEPAIKDFSAVIYGDSDFLTQQHIGQGINQDLVLNTIAFLAEETDLISVRQKGVQGSKLTMTTTVQAMVQIFSLLIPIVLMSIGSMIWFRRRNA